MSDDWFGQFINDNFRPYIQRDKGGYINKGLDYLFTPDQKNQYKYHVANLPFVGTYYRWQDQDNFWNRDYMPPRGLTWADVPYPTMVMGAGQVSGGVMRDIGSATHLSKTASKLYEGLKQDFGDWTPKQQPSPYIPSRVGLKNGHFYRRW